jgi:putative spermidine/putrescine transport system permease protein
MSDLNNSTVNIATHTLGGNVLNNKKESSFEKFIFDYVGLIPFFIFSIIFIFLPTGAVVLYAFIGNDGEFTFQNIQVAFGDVYIVSLLGSLQLGFVSAIAGSIAGILFAYGVVISGKKRLQRVVSTASGVFANTGGVPLAFFFVAAVGNYGLITLALFNIGIDIYSGSFTLFGFSGLVLVYLYFQIPLMIIVIYPAIEGMRNEWREAAVNLGATKWNFWRYIGVPVLLPAATGAFLLLFANAFAAYATANVLTSGTLPLIPIQIGTLVAGNVVADQTNVGYAMGLEMILVVGVAMAGYVILDRRVSRWKKK